MPTLLSPAASTCGCRCSARPRGSVRWWARWPTGRRWCRSSWLRSWWPAGVAVAGADAARWWWPSPRCCSWPPPQPPSLRSGRTGSRTTPWPTSPPTAPRSRQSARSPPTRTSSPVARGRSPETRWSGGSPCIRSPAAGRTLDLVAPVLVLGDADDARVPLGATVRLHGRLRAGRRQRPGCAAPTQRRDRGHRGTRPVVAAAGAVRQALRDSVAHRPADQRALVPALVDGDDAEVDPGLQDAFRATGLTHLLAVSGTNLTLVVGFLLALARWCRVRGRWLHVVAAAGIVGFVLIARTEPSVLRAAVMGTIGLVALGTDGRHRGPARPRDRGPGPGAARPVPGGVGRLRPVRARHRRHPAARLRPGATRSRAGCPDGWPRRSRCRRPRSSPARRWSRRSPGRSAWWRWWPTCWSPRWSGRRPCWGWRAGCSTLVWAAGRATVRDAGVVVRGLAGRGGRARRGAADGGGRVGDRRRRAGGADGAHRARRGPGAAAAARVR